MPVGVGTDVDCIIVEDDVCSKHRSWTAAAISCVGSDGGGRFGTSAPHFRQGRRVNGGHAVHGLRGALVLEAIEGLWFD